MESDTLAKYYLCLTGTFAVCLIAPCPTGLKSQDNRVVGRTRVPSHCGTGQLSFSYGSSSNLLSQSRTESRTMLPSAAPLLPLPVLRARALARAAEHALGVAAAPCVVIQTSAADGAALALSASGEVDGHICNDERGAATVSGRRANRGPSAPRNSLTPGVPSRARTPFSASPPCW